MTEPAEVYERAGERGMDFVTLTDHNTIEGCLALAHLPGTFLSVEFDATFPEDGVTVHVVALDIDEPTFREALRARRSVYELVDLLGERKILHFLAHPLFNGRGRLTTASLERMLLTFGLFEGLNGSRTRQGNDLVRQIVAGLTPERIEALAARHKIEPRGERPWHKGLVGGSDDHSGLFVASAHTVSEADDLQGFLRAVSRGECRPAGEDGDPLLLAHSIYSTAFWRIREILRLDGPTEARADAAPSSVGKDSSVETTQRTTRRVLTNAFGPIGRDKPVLDKIRRGARSVAPRVYRDGRGERWEALLQREIGDLLDRPGAVWQVPVSELNRRLFTVAAQLARDVAASYAQPLADAWPRPTVRTLAESASAFAMLQLLSLPYYVAFSNQTRDRSLLSGLATDVAAHADGAGGPRLAVATDRLEEGDGVTATIRHLVKAARDGGTEITVLACGLADPAAAVANLGCEVVSFPHVARRPLAVAPRPLRAHPAPSLAVPSPLDVLDAVYERAFTELVAVTAGPMGLVALAAGRLLHLPTARVRGSHPAPIETNGVAMTEY